MKVFVCRLEIVARSEHVLRGYFLQHRVLEGLIHIPVILTSHLTRSRSPTKS